MIGPDSFSHASQTKLTIFLQDLQDRGRIYRIVSQSLKSK